MDKKVLFFAGLVVLSYEVDIIMQSCTNRSLLSDMISFIHHIVSLYGILGSILFGNHKEHFIFLIIVLFGWAIFGECVLTIWYEKICDITPNSKRSHLDILSRIVETIFQIELSKPIILMSVFGLMLYDVYMFTHKDSEKSLHI